MTPVWRLELFGGLRAMRENELVDRFRTQKTAALLAYFALKPGPQPREVLINLLWPEAEPEAARNSLSASLSSLRRQLEPDITPGSVLLSTRASAGLQPEAFVCDVAEFDAALKTAERAKNDAERVEALARVVGTYSGPLLPGFYDDWLAAEARRREEEFSESLGDLLDLLDDEQDWERMIGFARHGLSLLPTREEWHLALMRAHQMMGKSDSALRQFEELRAVLAREGTEPSPKARRLALEAQNSRDAKRLAESSPEPPQVVGNPVTPPQKVIAELPSVPIASEPPLVESAGLMAPPMGTTTFLMLERPGGVREQEFVGRELEKRGGRLERQTAERMLWRYERCEDAAYAATAVQVGLATLPPDERLRAALCTDESSGHGGANESTLERMRVLMQGAHSGQVLCDEGSAGLLRAVKMPLLDLGRYRLVSSAPDRLFQLEYPSAPAFAPPRLTAAAASHLPPQFTRFFGRESEIQHLHRLLSQEETSLITLLGPGGSGKTRLSIEAARTLGDDRFSIYFVPLADISGESFVFPAIRDAMKLPTLTGVAPRDQLFEALAERPTLLILDNFEQLVEEGAHCVQELLGASPLLRLIVTSRQMLNLPGEREFPVPPLPVPAEDTSALLLKEISSAALFIDRAQASRVDFRVDERNAPYIAAICQRLDGIPLALELAAARSLVLSPAQMLEKLRDRLDILSTRQRGVPERHRTLRTAIEWSYSLLSPDLQQFFAALSVFRGGWTLEAAEAVCEELDALDFLTRLRECSLVVTQERGDETRFRMLETLREYAATQLRPAQSAHREQLYANYFAQLAEDAEPHLRGPQQAMWLERLEVEQDNFRAVLSWALEHDADAALRLAAALSPFWETRGHYAEGRDWLEKSLSLSLHEGASPPPQAEEPPANQESQSVRAQASDGAGLMANYATGFVGAGEAAPFGVWAEPEAAFEASSPAIARGRALCSAGRLAWFESQLDGARSLLEKGLAILRTAGDDIGVVNAISSLSMVLSWQGDGEGGVRLLKEGLKIVRPFQQRLDLLPVLANFGWALSFSFMPETLDDVYDINMRVVELARVANDQRSLAWALDGLAQCAFWRGDSATARRLAMEAISLFEGFNERFGKAHSSWVVAVAARWEKEFDTARRYNEQSLLLLIELKNRVGMPYILENYAYLAIEEGQFLKAALLLGGIQTARETLNPRQALVVTEHDRYVEILRARLDISTFDLAWEKGRRLNLEETIAEARRAPTDAWAAEVVFEATSPAIARGRALCSAGRLAWFESQLDGAYALLEKSLAILRPTGDEIGIVNAISSLSMVLSWQGNSEEGLSLLQEGMQIVRCLPRSEEMLPTFANFGWALSFASLPQTLDDVRDINMEVVKLARVVNDRRSLAWALDSLAQNYYWRGEWAASRRITEESVVLFEQMDERFGKSHSIWVRGNDLRREGRYDEARRYNEESLVLMLQIKNRVGMPYILESYAYLALEEGYPRRAALLLGAADSSREVVSPRQELVKSEYESYLEILRLRLDASTFDAAWQKGREMSIDEALDEARRPPDERRDTGDVP
ncbi:putative HTH-type transcriptional regulator [Abditibacteriota bacterium]|nr:putative HTH-type transcriptional regulator [Abditibacteriota bacterium]